MKFILIALTLIPLSSYGGQDALEVFESQHHQKLEELQKKWDMQEEECKKKYPQFKKKKHPHMDAFYKCIEVIDEEVYEFEEQYEDELCSRFKEDCD